MPLRHLVHSGTELSDSAQTCLTFADNLTEGGAILWGGVLVNRSSTDRRITVHLVASGGSPSETNCIYEETVRAHKTKVLKGGPWHENSGAFVSAIGESGTVDVGFRITASEEYHAGGR